MQRSKLHLNLGLPAVEFIIQHDNPTTPADPRELTTRPTTKTTRKKKAFQTWTSVATARPINIFKGINQ